MTPVRWNRIKKVFNAALERGEAESQALLDELDTGLRHEVERLLRQPRDTAGLLSPIEERNLSGQTISHYRVLDRIGQGGTAVVYQAEDTRLHRKVALKFLRREAIENPELKARFLREAEAAAALDHPNICTVYQIDEANGRTFLAMAYIDGPSLKDKIRDRPLKLTDALDIAIQIGEGLQAAHENGIVHRDIKSGNVMLTSHGQAKIVDFGLAHLAGAAKITRTGSVAGTPAYMSPEQVRGEEADHRTDIWALGVVLYEMVTGRLPFGDEAAQSVALAIQNREPDLPTALRSGAPVELDRIAGKALAKRVHERYQHVEDLLVDLRSLKRKLESGWQPVAPKRANRARWYVAGGALAAALAAAWIGYWTPWTRPEEVPLAPVPLTAYPGFESGPSFSPDGNEVAFSWNGEDGSNYDIYRKSIGPGAPLRLTSHPASDSLPRWSPDGQRIAFRRELGGGTEGIFLIPALGGVEQQLMEVRGQLVFRVRHAWSPDGKWLLTSDGTPPQEPYYLVLLSVATREKRRLTDPPQDSGCGDFGASFSPDGRSIVFCRGRTSLILSDVYTLALTEQLTPWGEPKRLAHDATVKQDPIWTPDGRDILFVSGSTISYSLTRRLWRISASGAAEAKPLPAIGPGVSTPAISSQRQRLAYSQTISNVDIWRIEISGPEKNAGPPKRLLASTRIDEQGRWSPDGRRIAFLSDRSGNPEIWLADRDGSNAWQLTSSGGQHVGWPSWSPDGHSLAFDSAAAGQRDIHVLSANGGVPRRLTEHPADDAVPCWSHDGKWIYFTSNRTGKYQIWKIPAAGGEAIRVTKNGGLVPFESSDGQFVFYTIGVSNTSLWKVPAGGGEETRVLEAISMNVEVAREGLYFVRTQGHSIEFLDFRTGQIRTIFSADKPIGDPSVSPDGHSIMFKQEDARSSDLMLVENFR
ncbi:MAG: PD40 domain-containing protein [Bryobacteraceae bacterium]|nr:PD40 domain-containing protein [Bryobacteraceae bacterium]